MEMPVQFVPPPPSLFLPFAPITDILDSHPLALLKSEASSTSSRPSGRRPRNGRRRRPRGCEPPALLLGPLDDKWRKKERTKKKLCHPYLCTHLVKARVLRNDIEHRGGEEKALGAGQ